MWYNNAVFYQIYPLGLCGAPEKNDGICEPRIQKIKDWIPHLQALGVDSVLFNPVLQSGTHGYDTTDYKTIDCRLGTNADFKAVCDALHKAGIRMVLDGVFNHVGRGFWAFQDVQENRESSPYKDWFHLSFDGDSNYGDGFWYEGWEGHYELVKLNLQNPAVVAYLLECVRGWIEEFDIDGLRLDVAYCLDHAFMRQLRSAVDEAKADFFLVGEMLHGDYKTIACKGMLHSATNYECYKGLYSSLNTRNFYEIAYSLNRQFGPEDWTLYKGLPLLNFVDNHDVTRAATVLEEPSHLPLLYGLLFGMPGIPCLYYGSEWGEEGDKAEGSDAALRPCIDLPKENALTALIAKMTVARRQYPALVQGSYKQVYLTNLQFVFKRELTGSSDVYIALNADSEPHTTSVDAGCQKALDVLTHVEVDTSSGLLLPAFSVQYIVCGTPTTPAG